ncbi:hypothetical protein [Microvirga pakistanensis]|uniref:hypothetical protein n=1 Tax=Microvirga pakistanensis TaxID=1682650 RepID=UPI001069460E|nr:hypothetical protein [Microvirga pakistanensis]
MVQKPTRSPEWNRRRTRHDPPSVEEAVTAAQGLTNNIDSQIEIAAQLMGLPEDEVRPVALEASVPSRLSAGGTALTPFKAGRTITVERRSHRLPLAKAGHR